MLSQVRQPNLVPETMSFPQSLLKSLEEALYLAYDRETCYPGERPDWTERLPAFGQCAVAALVVQDYLGGEILYDKENIHFWNHVEGHDVDMSRDQFPEGIEIKPSNSRTRYELLYGPRAEAAETLKRYQTLLRRVEQSLGNADAFRHNSAYRFD